MKRISTLLMSFLIFSTASAASTSTDEVNMKNTSSSSVEMVEKLSTSTENFISEDFSKIFIEKIDVIKQQFSAYNLRLGLVNQKISQKIDILSEQGVDVSEISEVVAESNSALKKSQEYLETISIKNFSEIENLNGMKSEDVLAFVYNAKNELGLAKNEIRKAQELGKIAVSKIKIVILE